MFFCASLIFAIMFPLLAVFAEAAARTMPAHHHVTVAGVLIGTYLTIFFLLHLSKACWKDIGDHGSGSARRLREVFGTRGLEWLNLVGIALVGTTAGIFLMAGVLPFSFWFLFGAIALGCSDLIHRRHLMDLPVDLPLPRRDLQIETDQPLEGSKRCGFRWLAWSPELRNTEAAMELMIQHDEYQQARNADRFSVENKAEYARYVLEGCTRSVEEVAASFRNRSKTRKLLAIQEMEDVICFTRGIRYASDPEMRGVDDWANFPVETLYDQAGDCEDHAILAAAILHALGHDVALFWLNLGDSAHLALGYRGAGFAGGGFSEVAEGKAYYYVETIPTQNGDRIGDMATQFLKDLKSAEVILV